MKVPSGLELVQSFEIVAEELSFRRSAERMNIDQSALSRRIRKLEDLLGFSLFERTTRDVSLTPAGQAFHQRNSRLLKSYSSSVDTARLVAEGKTGRLRICYMTFAARTIMPQTVALYKQQYPYVDVSMLHMPTQPQKVALANDEIDVGYLLGPFDHSEYRSIQLKRDPLCVVMPTGHPLAAKSEITPADLAGVDLVLGDMSEFLRQRLDELFSRQGVQLKTCMETLATHTMIGLVNAGVGATILPESIHDVLGSRVELRPIAHPDFFVPMLLVWRTSNRTKALLNYVEVAKSLYPG